MRTTLDQDQVTGRGDWLLNANSTVFARYTYTKQDSLAGGLQPLQGTGNASASTNAVLHWTQGAQRLEGERSRNLLLPPQLGLHAAARRCRTPPK